MAGTSIRGARILLVAACLLAVYTVSITNLKANPISHSEWNTQQHLFKTYLDPAYSVAETLASVKSRSYQHGPLYFILLNVWRNIAGRDLFSLRLFSVFCGILSIAFAWRLAAISGKGSIATIAAILTASVAYLIFYHQLVRMYSLLPLLVAVVVWAYWRVISAFEAPPAWRWAALVLASAALILVHYYGMIVLLAIGVYHLLVAPKNRKWLQTCLAMLAAGLLFVPWLPVALQGFSDPEIPTQNLAFIESVAAIAEIYTNGTQAILILAAGTIIWKFRLLNRSQRYIVYVTLLIALLMILPNEIMPLLVARRLRYTTILAIPLCCTIATGLNLLPWRRFTAPAIMCIWIIASFRYAGSENLALFSNRTHQNSDAVPLYQDFHYNGDSLPSRNALILSFHPDTRVDNHKVLAYYRWVLSDWAHVAHVTTDDSGDLVIQSGLSTYATLDAIVQNSNSVWVIHNPKQTDLNSLEVYRNWFRRNFQLCRRFIDTERSVIEYYLKIPIPCSLVADERGLKIVYDNGARLGGAALERKPDQLDVYLWWLHSAEAVYAYSLQVFDSRGDKIRQLDYVISGDPVDSRSLDLTGLPAGAYSVDLIVYDRQTGASQTGAIVSEGRSFERAVDLYRFEIDASA